MRRGRKKSKGLTPKKLEILDVIKNQNEKFTPCYLEYVAFKISLDLIASWKHVDELKKLGLIETEGANPPELYAMI